MTADAEQVARGILAELEDRLASKDRDRILDQWTEDAVLIGDAAENLTRDQTVAYLTGMAEMAPAVRWDGSLMGATEHFRTTCLAVEGSGGWRLKHFHGSEPQAD